MPLGVAQEVAALDSPIQAESHCPDQEELWLCQSVNIGTALAPATVQQPVTVASIPALVFVVATPAVDISVSSPVLIGMILFYCFVYDKLFLTVVRVTTNLMVDWSV